MEANFIWGEIQNVHEVGPYKIIEAIPRLGPNETRFYAYCDGQDLRRSFNTLDGALLHCMGYRADGVNSQFAEYALRMLNSGT